MKRSFSLDGLLDDLNSISTKDYSDKIKDIHSNLISSLVKLSVGKAAPPAATPAATPAPGSGSLVNLEIFKFACEQYLKNIPNDDVRNFSFDAYYKILSAISGLAEFSGPEEQRLFSVIGSFIAKYIYISGTKRYGLNENLDVVKTELRNEMSFLTNRAAVRRFLEKIENECNKITGASRKEILEEAGINVNYAAMGKISENLKTLAKPYLKELSQGFEPFIEFINTHFDNLSDSNEEFKRMYEEIKNGTYKGSGTEMGQPVAFNYVRLKKVAVETPSGIATETLDGQPASAGIATEDLEGKSSSPVTAPTGAVPTGAAPTGAIPTGDSAEFLKNFAPYHENYIAFENLSSSIVRGAFSLSKISHRHGEKDPQEDEKCSNAAQFILNEIKKVAGNSYSKLLLTMYIFDQLKIGY